MKKILFWIVVILVLIQFIPIDYNNPKVEEKDNFVSLNKPPKHIESLLKKACYDCHSNETVYPSYSKYAPVSWMIKEHVNEGRRYLNFSEWGSYTKELKSNALEKSILSIKTYEMPLPSYISKHPEANLTRKDRDDLVRYLDRLMALSTDKP